MCLLFSYYFIFIMYIIIYTFLFFGLHACSRGRDSSVGIATRFRAGRPGFVSRQGHELFPYSTASRSAPRPIKPPIEWVLAGVSLE
jgi:hypothetical protein